MPLNTSTISKLFLLLSFVGSTSAWSKNVKTDEILTNLGSIQIAAFKKSEAQLAHNALLKSYDICTISDAEFKRVFIVNIKKDRFDKVLFLTKKHYPDAFTATEKLSSLLGKEAAFPIQSQTLLAKKYDYHDGLLNAYSILHTHRNFF